MAVNCSEGQDYLDKHGLDGLPTADTLYATLCTLAEADVTPASTYVGIAGSLLSPGSGTVTVAGVSSVNRVEDLGALDFSSVVTGLAKSVVVTTKTPGAGALIYVVQNVNGGAALDLAAAGPFIFDDVSILIGSLVSGTVD